MTARLVSTQTRYPSHAETARTLVQSCPNAVLATLAESHPYMSVIELVPLEDGNIITVLSDLAQHSKNLKKDPRASLLLKHAHDAPLEHARVSLKGTLQVSPDAYRERYVAHHPKAESYFTAHDFKFYLFRVEAAYTIAGFGRMGWCTADAYAAAEPDPLYELAVGALEHMNEEHEHNLIDYAKAFLGLDWAENARLLTLDRYGFDLEVRGQSEGVEKIQRDRISFTKPLDSADTLRSVMVHLAEEAKKRLRGDT